MTEWTRIGECDVDAGCIMIIDPCYVLPDNKDSKPKYTYEEFLQKSFKFLKQEVGESLDEFNHRKNIESQKPLAFGGGVIASTRDGDGTFPVYARYERKGDRRPSALMIDFSSVECEGCGGIVSDIDELNKCETQGGCCTQCGEPNCEGEHCECCDASTSDFDCDCSECEHCGECIEHECECRDPEEINDLD